MNCAMTGGASGIGAATLTRLKAEGHTVTCIDLSEPQDADHWIETPLPDRKTRWLRSDVVNASNPQNACILWLPSQTTGPFARI